MLSIDEILFTLLFVASCFIFYAALSPTRYASTSVSPSSCVIIELKKYVYVSGFSASDFHSFCIALSLWPLESVTTAFVSQSFGVFVTATVPSDATSHTNTYDGVVQFSFTVLRGYLLYSIFVCI